jgi:hypothetical protein
MKTFLGRLLYPNLHPALQKKKLHDLGVMLIAGLAVSVVFALILWLANSGISLNKGHPSGSGSTTPRSRFWR